MEVLDRIEESANVVHTILVGNHNCQRYNQINEHKLCNLGRTRQIIKLLPHQ